VVPEIASNIHNCRVKKGQVTQAVWQVVDRWHGGIVHEHRNYGHALSQSCLDLDTHRVSFILNSMVFVRRSCQPARPYHHYKDLALEQLASNVGAVVHAEGNIVDVHENGIFAVSGFELIGDAPGYSRRIRSAIRNDDPRHPFSKGATASWHCTKPTATA
jgi:hypothetical protein